MNQSNNLPRRSVSALLTTFILTILCGATAFAQTTAFIYQGRFADTSMTQPTNGTYTMTFQLYDAAGGNTQIGSPITSAVSVVNGLFTARLDFGATAFNTTAARYLEIRVGSTTLTPRQEITSTPFSQRALNASNAERLGGVAANQFVQTNDSRLTDSRTPAAGSTNYIQNTTAQQTSSNFNISGNGTASSLAVRGGGTGLTLNDNFLRLRTSGDNNHGIVYNSTIDGMEFRANIGYRWLNGTNGATQRMSLDNSGNLTVGGNITTTGTIIGTLANDSVGTAQVADGSLRLADTAVFSTTAASGGATVGPHACVSFTLPNGLNGVVANDIVYFIPPITSPAGFSFQPVYLTGSGAFSYPFCNTLNTNNTLPAQTYRIVAVRP